MFNSSACIYANNIDDNICSNSLFRQPFNKVGWELDKHTKEEWSTIKNNQLYNMCLVSPYLVNADNIISNYYS